MDTNNIRIDNPELDNEVDVIGINPITLEEMSIIDWLNRPISLQSDKMSGYDLVHIPYNIVVKFRNDYYLLNLKELLTKDEYNYPNFGETIIKDSFNCDDQGDDNIYLNLGEIGIPDICVTESNFFDVLYNENFEQDSGGYKSYKFVLVDTSHKITIANEYGEKCNRAKEINIGELRPVKNFSQLGGYKLGGYKKTKGKKTRSKKGKKTRSKKGKKSRSKK